MIKAATYMCNAQYLKKRTLHILIILHEGDRESFFPPTRVASYHFHSLAHFTFYQMNSCFSSSGWHPHKRKGVRAYRCSSVYIDIYGRWCSHVCKSQLRADLSTKTVLVTVDLVWVEFDFSLVNTPDVIFLPSWIKKRLQKTCFSIHACFLLLLLSQ